MRAACFSLFSKIPGGTKLELDVCRCVWLKITCLKAEDAAVVWMCSAHKGL